MYYAAYGSNLNKRQMGVRCPGATPVCVGFVRGYGLLFKGSLTGNYLTIEPMENDKVPVAIWDISKENEVVLDRYEGFPKFYYKKNISVETENGVVEAVAYIMHENRTIGLPESYYLDVCYEGYQDFNLNTEFLKRAVRRSDIANINKE